MNRDFRYYIGKKDNRMTIADYLKQIGFSRHVLTQLKKQPLSIIKNGRPALLNCALQEGEQLDIHYMEESSSLQIPPVYYPLSIVFEDEDIIVINKPFDMPVHPSINNYENTLANALCYYYQKQNQTFTFRCINRLDRDTTGLLIVAKHAVSACILSEQMKKRQIHREYLAIASGMIPAKGIVNAPIARKETSAIERRVDFLSGDKALTRFQRLSYYNGYSLVSLRLESGRTHQIRVHMNYIGHPLPGDYLYSSDDRLIKRQALHSWQLRFTHPISKKAMFFITPVPEDFLPFLKNC